MPNTVQLVPAVFAYSGLDGIDYYNSSTTVTIGAGQVVKMATSQGVMYGITRQPILPLTMGAVAVTGCFDLVLDGASTFVQGDVVYWNAGLNVATSSGSYTADVIGVCAQATAVAASDVSVRVWLTSWFLR